MQNKSTKEGLSPEQNTAQETATKIMAIIALSILCALGLWIGSVIHEARKPQAQKLEEKAIEAAETSAERKRKFEECTKKGIKAAGLGDTIETMRQAEDIENIARACYYK